MSEHNSALHAAALEADRAEAAALALAGVARERAIALQDALQAAGRAARVAVDLAAKAEQAALDLDKANTDAAQATVLAGDRVGAFAKMALAAIAESHSPVTK